MGEGKQRNLPCPCGSKKKYKNCCMDKKRVPQDVINYFNNVIAEKKIKEDMGIYINYVKPILWQGKKVWAIGNRVYHNRPPDETFHQFIIDILRITLGKDWWEENLNLSFEEKHFILKCYFKFYDWLTRGSVKREKVTGAVFAAKPDGWSKSLLSLAFDVCSLMQIGNLPECLVERLKNKNEYQGARYEITIAAIFARLGCKIEFLDEKDKPTIKHCEFIATHQETGTSIAVEVKSRHRAGVIHTFGIKNEEDLLKGDVQRLLKKALEQNPGDRPFMIFIDLNSPITPEKEVKDKQWFEDIKNIIAGRGARTAENPDLYNAIIVTNYSYHYQTEKEADKGEFLQFVPLYPKFPLPNDKFMEMLRSALNYYGNVPNLDIDGELN